MTHWSVRRVGRRAGMGLFCGVMLTGCGMVGEAPFEKNNLVAKDRRAAPQAPPQMASKVLKQIEMARGKVVVRPPAGYCIDANASKTSAMGGGFVLMAGCDVLGHSGAGAETGALITVQVQGGVLGGLSGGAAPDSAGLMRAMAPARAISREDGDGISYVHLDRGGDQVLPKGDPRHWRGAMMINRQLVGVAIYGPKGGQVAGAEGETLLVAVAEELLEASPVRDYRNPVGSNSDAKPMVTQKKTDQENKGFAAGFRKLFQKRDQ